jgi:hypothetical protein
MKPHLIILFLFSLLGCSTDPLDQTYKEPEGLQVLLGD